MTKVTAIATINQQMEVSVPIEQVSTDDMIRELRRRGCTAIKHVLVDEQMKWQEVEKHIDRYTWNELADLLDK